MFANEVWSKGNNRVKHKPAQDSMFHIRSNNTRTVFEADLQRNFQPAWEEAIQREFYWCKLIQQYGTHHQIATDSQLGQADP